MWYREVGDLGAKRVTQELVCYLPILDTFGWNGGSRGHTRQPGSRQGTTVCVHMRVGMEQLSDQKTMTPSGTGLLGCGARSHLLVALVFKRDCANGSEPEPIRQFRIMHPSHSDDEPLFGPQNSPELIVGLSLDNSVEFKVRRAPGAVPYSIRMDHGDILALDGPAQSEYEHRTASGLRCARVNLTFRWITQHITSCPLGLCSAFGCARFSRAGSP